jgi:hypothetical protein
LSSPVPKVDYGRINFFRENTKNSYLLKEAANFNGFGLEKKKLKSKGISWYMYDYIAFLAKLKSTSSLMSKFRDVQFWHRKPEYVPFWNRKVLSCPVLDPKMLFKDRLFLCYYFYFFKQTISLIYVSMIFHWRKEKKTYTLRREQNIRRGGTNIILDPPPHLIAQILLHFFTLMGYLNNSTSEVRQRCLK